MMMSMSIQQHSAAITDHTLASDDTREVVKSRFGEIVIDIRNTLLFPRGLLGMPESRHFALANFPSAKMQQFKLLQCLDDFALSFIALPAGVENGIIARADMQAACRELGIGEDALVMLLVVCVHRGSEATKLSVNARAPIFIDVSRKVGLQHVFTSDQYKVQQFIN